MGLNQQHRRILLDLARRSIQNGLVCQRPLTVDLSGYPDELTRPVASFVTLAKNHQLRGCIGMLQAIRPLLEDICENAFSAAFKDPRFPPLKASEWSEISLHLALLSPAEAVEFRSESDLVKQIRQQTDGLILEYKQYSATFLPSVWQSITTAEQFLRHLKQKAGLDKDFWSNQIKIFRYTTETIE